MWKGDKPDAAAMHLPSAQQPKASTADSPPAPGVKKDLPDLQPVIRTGKAGRKRKLVGTDQPRSAEYAAQQSMYKQMPTCYRKAPFTDEHASQHATVNMHSAGQEPPAQNTATNTMCSTAVEGNKQSGLDSTSSQKLQDSRPLVCTGDLQQAGASTEAASHIGHSPEPAPSSTEVCLARQTLRASPLLLPATQEDEHNHQRKVLRERAKSLQSEANRLLSEAQQPVPRTVEQVEQDELNRIHPERVQAYKSQLSQSVVAQACGVSVEVAAQPLPSQAAEIAQRCEGLAVRGCAVPLQNGRIMCPDAQPHMATIGELRHAAASQQIATAQGDL